MAVVEALRACCTADTFLQAFAFGVCTCVWCVINSFGCSTCVTVRNKRVNEWVCVVMRFEHSKNMLFITCTSQKGKCFQLWDGRRICCGDTTRQKSGINKEWCSFRCDQALSATSFSFMSVFVEDTWFNLMLIEARHESHSCSCRRLSGCFLLFCFVCHLCVHMCLFPEVWLCFPTLSHLPAVECSC